MDLNIQELYKSLPRNSRCYEAVNHKSFYNFLNKDLFNTPDWPFAGLFTDKDGKIRWLLVCNSVMLAEFESGIVDGIVSKNRNEELECIEVYCRNGMHFFL